MTDIREQLLHQALTYPESWEDFPWENDLVVKVRKKVFVFLGSENAATPTAGLKLTDSLEEALQFEGVQPSGYGLGRWGWVQVPLAGSVPGEIALDWLDESYRAVAPKSLVVKLDRQV